MKNEDLNKSIYIFLFLIFLTLLFVTVHFRDTDYYYIPLKVHEETWKAAILNADQEPYIFLKRDGTWYYYDDNFKSKWEVTMYYDGKPFYGIRK